MTRSSDTLERLFDAAIELIGEHGYAGTTVDEIVAANWDSVVREIPTYGRFGGFVLLLLTARPAAVGRPVHRLFPIGQVSDEQLINGLL